MSVYILAVAGKGGTGKTTICGMLIDWLCSHGRGPVLAVDADANSNLNEVLGVEVEHTLGEIRELIAGAEKADVNPIPASISTTTSIRLYFLNTNRSFIILNFQYKRYL